MAALPNCKTLFFITLSIATLLSSAVFTLAHSPHSAGNPPYLSSICHAALNPDACLGFVSEVVYPPRDPTDLLKKMLIKQIRYMNSAFLQTKQLKNRINDRCETGALTDCLQLIDLSTDLVVDSIKSLQNQFAGPHDDAHAWLSAVLTNHVTCLEGLHSFGKKFIGQILEDLISRARASLAVLAAIAPPEDEMIQLPTGKLPSWVAPADRKLLQMTALEIKPNVTVAKDGTGDYRTVAEAIAAAPNRGKDRYIIRVKKGKYKEVIRVAKNKKNLMIFGDGRDSTIITGDRNVADNFSTFESATFAAVGEGFILQDICIQNTAGPAKNQAVALRVGADKSVINRCKIDAFQDTLYPHSLRQFYRECNVTGTVDFIFGNAAVVFQKCELLARKPRDGQKNMVTAQGRSDPNQNTGTSIQDCEIRPSPDLEPVKNQFPTYLGRPWRNFSRTVVMQSYIGDHVDPAGWSKWSGDFALATLYYGEYMNRGPGAGTAKRVNWPGYHVITDAAEAMKFTVKELIQGSEWLGSTGVAYTEGLGN